MYKRLLLCSKDENSIGGRPYPRTEAPGVETPEIIDDSRENSRGEAISYRTEVLGAETPEKRLYPL